jgi:hypothetical protein
MKLLKIISEIKQWNPQEMRNYKDAKYFYDTLSSYFDNIKIQPSYGRKNLVPGQKDLAEVLIELSDERKVRIIIFGYQTTYQYAVQYQRNDGDRSWSEKQFRDTLQLIKFVVDTFGEKI